MTKQKKRNCEPRPCRFCGEIFTPTHGNRKLCDDCRIRFGRHQGLEWAITYDGPANNEEYEKRLAKQNREKYRDTIVAIGYADRQREATLKLAGRVDPHL